MNACSCLTLILACIVYWQAREISRLAAAPDFPFDPDLLRHVSPIEWKNIVLYGEIKIDPRQAHEAWPLACISTRIWSVPLRPASCSTSIREQHPRSLAANGRPARVPVIGRGLMAAAETGRAAAGRARRPWTGGGGAAVPLQRRVHPADRVTKW